jgi:hypothetical protein
MWVASWQRADRAPESQGFESQRHATRHLLTVAGECAGRICAWELDDIAPTWPTKENAA